MNKKKKNSRIKHRKSQNRIKKIKQLSLLKAKPKKTIAINQPDVDLATDIVTEKVPDKKSATKKTATKKTVTKKAASKKPATKKATTKKTVTKKT